MKKITSILIATVLCVYVATQVMGGSSMSMKSSHRPSKPLKTGQTTSYATGDDGDLELGIIRSYTVYTTGQYSGTTEISVDGVAHNMSNAKVRDNRTGIDWMREVVTSDIGPGGAGKFFWEQYTLTGKTDISFVNSTGKIHSAGGDFNTDALCAGRRFTISGSSGNDGTYTVSAVDANDITTVEGVADEGAGATIDLATSGGLILDMLAAVNAAGVGGHTDWRIPNAFELYKLVDLGEYNPCINTTVFPSTPSSYHWTASTRPGGTTIAFGVNFGSGNVNGSNKQTVLYYVRLCRG